MDFWKSLFKTTFTKWIETATYEELANGYEVRRQQWIKDGCNGNGEITPEMKRINHEMSRRTAERLEKNPRRNADSNFRWTDANRWDKD